MVSTDASVRFQSPLLLVLVAAALVHWLGSPVAVAASPSAELPQGSSEQAPGGQYRRWLAEDVPFIITQEEKAMFAKLTTDKDRQRFVREFWERRNPKPGSPENAFKQEYYARLAYAKQHFHYLSTEVRDDRARIYILYGPPNKIEPATHHNEKLSGVRETWTYNRLEGIGDNVVVQFTGAPKSGEYHVVSDPEASRRPSG